MKQFSECRRLATTSNAKFLKTILYMNRIIPRMKNDLFKMCGQNTPTASKLCAPWFPTVAWTNQHGFDIHGRGLVTKWFCFFLQFCQHGGKVDLHRTKYKRGVRLVHHGKCWQKQTCLVYAHTKTCNCQNMAIRTSSTFLKYYAIRTNDNHDEILNFWWRVALFDLKLCLAKYVVNCSDAYENSWQS